MTLSVAKAAVLPKSASKGSGDAAAPPISTLPPAQI